MDWLVWGVLGLVLVDGLLCHFGPKAMMTFRRDVRVDAAPEDVWRAVDLFAPGAECHIAQFELQEPPEDRPAWARLKRINGGSPEVVDVECLERTVGRRLVTRCARFVDGDHEEDYPHTEHQTEEFELVAERDGGTTIRQTLRIPLPVSLANWWKFGGLVRSEQRDLKHLLATGEKRTPTSRRGPVMLVLSLLAAMWWFGPVEGAMIVGIIAVHEVGHAIAFRLVGEKVFSISFIPLLGGLTTGSPPKTAVRDAIVSLGGTTFSWIALVLLLLASVVFDHGPTTEGFETVMTTGEVGFAEACVIAFFLGLLINVLNLLPIPFLDGGRTLVALSGRLSPVLVARAMGVVGLLIAAALFWVGMVVFAVICGFLSILSFSPAAARRAYAPPSYGGVAAILGMYLGQFVLYGAAVALFVVVVGLSADPEGEQVAEAATAQGGRTAYAAPTLRGSLDGAGTRVELSASAFRNLELSAVSP